MQGIPVLLVWGREDHSGPFELSERLEDFIPNVEFRAIDETAHIPHFERPEVVNPLVIAFLSR
jgi:pimeloyl-ACP methyl ester carboxylesterase